MIVYNSGRRAQRIVAGERQRAPEGMRTLSDPWEARRRVALKVERARKGFGFFSRLMRVRVHFDA